LAAWATLLFVAAGICFILGLKLLAKTHTARRGNLVSALGMLLAVAGTFLEIVYEGTKTHHDYGFTWIILGLIAGAAVGIPFARLVKMTGMPEMVALFNGFGGIASLLVGWSQLHTAVAASGDGTDVLSELSHTGSGSGYMAAAAIFLAMLIGGVTFTGSLVAFGKLSGRLTSKPVLYHGQNLINGVVVAAILAAGVFFGLDPDAYWVFLVSVLVSLFLGVAVVIPIGGADMPVVISLLNAYSGLAACAAGFAVDNKLLIVTGALVGASGIILTRIMCKAMNRSLANVLFSGFGAGEGKAAAKGEAQGEAKSMTPEDAYFILEAARSVVFIPGYGMAVAQAQHAVRELAQNLEANDCEVKFAIHPVAGRMPGHMNVLLAEANVSYDQLIEMDDINPQMEMVDVAVVIGANDVVNPAARTEKDSPIYGMPIIDADKARTVFVLKRSMASGFAGIPNPLFFLDNTYMIFGDAKKTLEALVAEFKDALQDAAV